MSSKRTITLPSVSLKIISKPYKIESLLNANGLVLSKHSNQDYAISHLRYLPASKSLQIISTLLTKGVIKYEDCSYEVEMILDHDVDSTDNCTYYLIKWKDWPVECSTWENEDNLDTCAAIVKEYNDNVKNGIKGRTSDICDDRKCRLRLEELLDAIDCTDLTPNILRDAIEESYAKPVRLEDIMKKRTRDPSKVVARKKISLDNRRSKTYITLKAKMQRELKQWEKHLNSINTDPAPIYVENNVDLEGPPWSFTFINQRSAHSQVSIPQDPLFGCSCTDCFDNRLGCSAIHNNTETECSFPYTKNGKLRAYLGSAIYECNSRCSCPPTCSFRVVQNGRKVKVTIFRTVNRGWGVKSAFKIPRGTFISEYVGEVITFDEAERRGLVYDKEAQTYLFDLDFAGEPMFSVDARDMGNVSHFINHSCEPNLDIRCVFIDCMDIYLPRLALYANRDIAANEELTFDYRMSGLTEKSVVAENAPQSSDADTSRDIVVPPPSKKPLLDGSVSSASIDTAAVDQLSTRDNSPESSHAPSEASGSGTAPVGPAKIKCLCNAPSCRGYLFN